MFNGIIRKLEPQDIGEIEKIFDLYWSGDFRHHLSDRLKQPPQDFKWFVAEENGELVGVAASRKAPERMMQYAKTDKVVEFYVAAAKYKGRGIWTALRNVRINEAKKKDTKKQCSLVGIHTRIRGDSMTIPNSREWGKQSRRMAKRVRFG